MNATLDVTHPQHPWLDRLAADPGRAIDSLLRGVAHLPGLQRASPSEALMALLGDLPAEAPQWRLLDQALLAWLKARRQADDGLLERPGGLERFIRETGEAFRAAWRLELPESGAWIRAELFDLLRWADGFSIDATFDLGRSVLTAAANLQQGGQLHFLWLRVCDEAALPRLRHRLDAALLGLAKVTEARSGGAAHQVLVGLARWAGHLPTNEQGRSEVVREWRALKAAFPRQPSFWREQWQAILDDERIAAHPFTHWLRDADPALQAPSATGKQRRVPVLPKNITGTIKEMKAECGEQGLTEPLWRRMGALLQEVENYADTTGESYYLVTSCTNIASVILNYAPGRALTLTRRALLWSPSHGHAWSVRASALDRLGRPDLSEAVLWEAVRRIPSDLPLYIELALALVERSEHAEAEVLLRKAATMDPNREHGATFGELARVLWLRGRADEALALLRDFLAHTRDSINSYLLGCLLVAEGHVAVAAAELQQYIHIFGKDKWATIIELAIAAGKGGQEEMCKRLRERRQRHAVVADLPAETEDVARILALEQAELPRLEKIGVVAKADLLFALGEERRDDALRLVDAALRDPSDAYAQVVKGLAIPAYRVDMQGRTGRFAGSLPVRLALTPENVPAEYWRDLGRHFPEGRHLIDLVQLARGPADDVIRARLAAWCDTPAGWDSGWDTYLKATLRRHLDGDDIPVDLVTLAHDALTQAVDVGMDATPLAA